MIWIAATGPGNARILGDYYRERYMTAVRLSAWVTGARQHRHLLDAGE